MGLAELVRLKRIVLIICVSLLDKVCSLELAFLSSLVSCADTLPAWGKLVS